MTEVEAVKQALQQAIDIEVQGKTFYLESAQKGTHPLAQRLFRQLAREEDVHRKTAEDIFAALSAEAKWPEGALHISTGADLKAVFNESVDRNAARASASEAEAFQVAMKLEQKSYDFYHERAGKAAFPREEEFYQALMREERGHFLLLFDALEYLRDPQGWFVSKERPSLDGG